MAAGDSSAPHYVELLVTDSMYNVIIDNNVESQHLELFTPEEVQGVISDADDTAAVAAVTGDVKHSIRVYQAFKSVNAPHNTTTTAVFKDAEITADGGGFASLSDESAQAVKTILTPQLQEVTSLHQQQHEQQQHHHHQQQQQHQQQQHQEQQQQQQNLDLSNIRLHQCSHCSYSASTSYNLKVHINNRHTNEVKYQCNQCPFFSYTKASLNYHVKSHNLSEYKTCPQCSYSTHSKSGLLNHIKTHAKQRPFQCPHCPYAAARKMTLKEHMEVLHNSMREIYNCPQCSFKTNWGRALKKHMKIHTGDLFNCTRCVFSCTDKTILLDHEISSHNIDHREYICPHCQYTSDQQYKLEDHIHKRHEPNQRALLYSCPDCNYKTRWKRLIKGHRRVHTGELFRCKKCDFATITKTRLGEHEQTHLEMSQREYACPHCTYRATRQTRLNEHVANRHYPDKKETHKCEKCEFQTRWKSYLKIHRKVHTGEVFKCCKCSYTTPVRSQLQRHERSLHKIGPAITTANNLYKCPHCSYAAARKGRLSEHIQVRHSKVKNEVYSCPVCTFKTVWKKSLKVHLNVHENEVFNCDSCSYTTPYNKEFKRHVKSHHGKDVFGCSECVFVGVGINYIDNHVSEEDPCDNSEESGRGELQQCNNCSFSSSSSRAFKVHSQIHVGQPTEQTKKTMAQTKIVYRTVVNGALLPTRKIDILY